MTTKEAVALLERYSNYDGMGIPNLAGCKEAMRVAVDALKEACPELRESEDERIRKWLIDYFSSIEETVWIHRDITCEQILAYLEKQKENVEKEYVFRPLAGTNINTAVLQAIRRANEGDRLVLAFNGAYIPVRKGCNANKIVDIYDAFIEKQKEQKPISQEDFDEAKHEALWGEQKPAEWSDYKDKVNVPYCSSEPEWSEEDEKMLRTIISDGSRGVELDSKQISWLKSLRPSWKPSKEQMKALEDAFRKNGSDEYRKTINSLYQDLKKL